MKTEIIQIIVNPAAGSGKAKNAAKYLEQKIRIYREYEMKMTFTEKNSDAVHITREAIINGATKIVAVGGDGTVNEVVNGFFIDRQPLNPLCELGIINCGTGCGFAKSLKNSRSVAEQTEQIFLPGYAPIDLGVICYKDFSGKTAYRLFVNECQIGIGSMVASAVGKKSKVFGGTIAFGFTAVALAMSMSPINLSLSYDGEAYHEANILGLVVGNGTECAGGMKLTPDAKLNDGFFDVLLIHNMKTVRRMLNLSKVYSGKHIPSPHFSIKKCKKLSIRSKMELAIEGDGEILGNSPFDIEILPSAIRVKAANNIF
jgi:diacylglycerol kinase (ATP)